MEHEPWRLAVQRRLGSKSCFIGMFGVTWLIGFFFIEQSLLDDPAHSALSVLTT